MAKACAVCERKPRTKNIQFQEDNPTTDALGGQANPWLNPTLVTTAKAAIEPIRGMEMYRAQAIQNPVSHRITIAYRRGIKHEHRIRWVDRGTERLFNIKSIIDIEEMHKWLEIMAVENVPT